MVANADALTSPSLEQRLDELFAPWNRADAPGLVVAVAKNGKLLYRRGWGMASLETGVANSPRTRMRIGSTSKHFTCLLAMLLAEDGKLDIDAPLRTYIPELAGPAGDPTLRQLMQHRGGVRCHLEVAALKTGLTPPPVGSALATQVRQTGASFAPGEAMLYSNGGYHLLAIAIERAGGASFEELSRVRLFEPLGMADTASVPSDYTIVPGAATLHMPAPGGGWRRGIFPSEEIRGEGAIISTVDDMLRWMAHLRRPDRVGSAATWQAMMTPGVNVDGSAGLLPYALGLAFGQYRGQRIIHHSGGVFGGTSQMLILPDHELDIVVIANGGPGAIPVKLANDVVDLVLPEHLAESPANVSAKGYEPLFGDWWSEEARMLYSLGELDGALKLEACKAPAGAPLERHVDGRAAFGNLTVDIDGALAAADGRLVIGFCGRDARFERVSEGEQDLQAFARAVAGGYHSRDADLTIDLAVEGDRLMLRARDAPAGLQAEVGALAPNLGYTKPGTSGLGATYMIQILREDGEVSGLRLQGGRLRNLDFDRLRG